MSMVSPTLYVSGLGDGLGLGELLDVVGVSVALETVGLSSVSDEQPTAAPASSRMAAGRMVRRMVPPVAHTDRWPGSYRDTPTWRTRTGEGPARTGYLAGPSRGWSRSLSVARAPHDRARSPCCTGRTVPRPDRCRRTGA